MYKFALKKRNNGKFNKRIVDNASLDEAVYLFMLSLGSDIEETKGKAMHNIGNIFWLQSKCLQAYFWFKKSFDLLGLNATKDNLKSLTEALTEKPGADFQTGPLNPSIRLHEPGSKIIFYEDALKEARHIGRGPLCKATRTRLEMAEHTEKYSCISYRDQISANMAIAKAFQHRAIYSSGFLHIYDPSFSTQGAMTNGALHVGRGWFLVNAHAFLKFPALRDQETRAEFLESKEKTTTISVVGVQFPIKDIHFMDGYEKRIPSPFSDDGIANIPNDLALVYCPDTMILTPAQIATEITADHFKVSVLSFTAVHANAFQEKITIAPTPSSSEAMVHGEGGFGARAHPEAAKGILSIDICAETKEDILAGGSHVPGLEFPASYEGGASGSIAFNEHGHAVGMLSNGTVLITQKDNGEIRYVYTNMFTNLTTPKVRDFIAGVMKS